MASKEKKDHVLYGIQVLMVARKEGEPEWSKEINHDKGIILGNEKFRPKGWTVLFFQIGFYQPSNNLKTTE